MMNDYMNKPSTSSVVSLDIIDYSVKSEAEKLVIKASFDRIISMALADIPEQDRVVVDAVNGVAIACNGPLEDALEDALFISLTVRDEILKHNSQSQTPLYVQIGIHLGDTQLAKDADGKPGLAGEGLHDAQRVMCFANPNQILVTQQYYEKAASLTHEIAQMFEKHDMHTLEHDVYAVRLLKEAPIEELPTIPADIVDLKPSMASKINWKYIASVTLGLLVFFIITKVGLEPTEPKIVLDEPLATTTTQPKVALTLDAEPTAEAPDMPNLADHQPASQAETVAVSNDNTTENQAEVVEEKVIPKPNVDVSKKVKPQHKVAQQADNETKPTAIDNKKTPASTANLTTKEVHAKEVQAKEVNVTTPTKQAELKTEKNIVKDKSGWESFKEGLARGAERRCTQGEIAMNQCPQ